jgi:hypothetical protein
MDALILLAILKLWVAVGFFLTLVIWFVADRFYLWVIIGWPVLIFALLDGHSGG